MNYSPIRTPPEARMAIGYLHVPLPPHVPVCVPVKAPVRLLLFIFKSMGQAPRSMGSEPNKQHPQSFSLPSLVILLSVMNSKPIKLHSFLSSLQAGQFMGSKPKILRPFSFPLRSLASLLSVMHSKSMKLRPFITFSPEVVRLMLSESNEQSPFPASSPKLMG